MERQTHTGYPTRGRTRQAETQANNMREHKRAAGTRKEIDYISPVEKANTKNDKSTTKAK
jgi:hypothetical protein